MPSKLNCIVYLAPTALVSKLFFNMFGIIWDSSRDKNILIVSQNNLYVHNAISKSLRLEVGSLTAELADHMKIVIAFYVDSSNNTLKVPCNYIEAVYFWLDTFYVWSGVTTSWKLNYIFVCFRYIILFFTYKTDNTLIFLLRKEKHFNIRF